MAMAKLGFFEPRQGTQQRKSTNFAPEENPV